MKERRLTFKNYIACLIDAKSGNIKFDLFWQHLRNCFDENDSLDQTKVTHHVMLAFEKPASKCLSTIDKKSQLTGKVGPEKRKDEDDNSKPSADDNWCVMNKRFNELFPLMGQIVKNTNSPSQKENQGQGRRGDSDRRYNKERETYLRQGRWDSKTQSRDHNDESRQYANTKTA